MEAELTMIWPGSLAAGWEAIWQPDGDLRTLCPALDSDVSDSLTEIGMQRHTPRKSAQAANLPEIGGLELIEQKLWNLPHGLAVWVGRFRIGQGAANLRDMTQRLYLARNKMPDFAVTGIELDSRWGASHLVHCRLKPSEIFLKDEKGFSAQAMYRIAAAEAASFSHRPDEDELSSARREYSRDHRNLLFATSLGALIVSTRKTPLEKESDFHRPDQQHMLALIPVVQKMILNHLLQTFSSHRAERNPNRAGKLILQDRAELTRLEQVLLFPRVTGHHFGQRVCRALTKTFEVMESAKEVKNKIEMLAENVRDSRADFFQTILFLVTVLFAPLAITAGMFSGTHMMRGFAEDYLAFFPQQGQWAGILQFLSIFLAIALLLGVMWLLVKWAYGRKNILRWFRKVPPS
ncbi:MAG: hypothetical protein JRF33_27920 [Deltaproteobacteria bacterium]|nr:hypothetical protein [Deltaproteobacteria bacterium]